MSPSNHGWQGVEIRSVTNVCYRIYFIHWKKMNNDASCKVNNTCNFFMVVCWYKWVTVSWLEQLFHGDVSTCRCRSLTLCAGWSTRIRAERILSFYQIFRLWFTSFKWNKRCSSGENVHLCFPCATCLLLFLFGLYLSFTFCLPEYLASIQRWNWQTGLMFCTVKVCKHPQNPSEFSVLQVMIIGST